MQKKLPLGIAIRGALFALLITNVLIVRKYIRITYIHSLFEEPFQNIDKIQAIKVIVETYRIQQMCTAWTVHKKPRTTSWFMVLDRTWLRFNFDYPKVKEIPGAPWESLRFVSVFFLLSFKHQATFGTATINIYRLDFMVKCFAVQELHGVKHVNKIIQSYSTYKRAWKCYDSAAWFASINWRYRDTLFDGPGYLGRCRKPIQRLLASIQKSMEHSPEVWTADWTAVRVGFYIP